MNRRSRQLGWISITVLCVLLTIGCSRTQKTGGHGYTSVVAQNVVRLAGVESLRNADFGPAVGKRAAINLTGFVDDMNEPVISQMVRAKAEEAGVRVVRGNNADHEIEVVVRNAGIDQGDSRVPIISRSERCEGTVDLELVVRNLETGEKSDPQYLRAQAKYEQSTTLGIQGSGTYFVKKPGGKFAKVRNPMTYQ